MYLPPSDDESKRSVEVQFGHSVIHPAVFPFDRLQRGFQIVATVCLLCVLRNSRCTENIIIIEPR